MHIRKCAIKPRRGTFSTRYLIAVPIMTAVVLQDIVVEPGVLAKTVIVPKAGGIIKAASKSTKLLFANYSFE